MQLSPDGTLVGYFSDRNDAAELFVAPITSPDRTIRIAPAIPGDGTGLSVWYWAYDDRHILAEQPVGEYRHVFAYDRTRAIWRDLTPTATSARVVHRSPRYPNDVAIALAEGDSTRLVRVDIRTGEVRDIARETGFEQLYLDHEFRVRVARKRTREGVSVYRRTDDGWVPIVTYRWLERYSGVVSLTADGDTLYLVDNLDRDKAALKSVDLATGVVSVIARDTLADLLPFGPTVHPRTGEVQAVVSYFVRMRRQVLDPDTAIDFAMLNAAHPGDVSFVGQSLDDSVWLVRYMSGGPLVYAVYDRATRQVYRLFSDLSALDDETLASRHRVIVPARDGLPLPCDLYLPPGADSDGDGRPDRPLPTVLYVHGGPWIGFGWNSWFTNRSFQLLANRGYAVIRADFRGSMGYGRVYMDAGDREFAGKMHTDLVDIAGWAVDADVSPRDGIAIWGWSYGGYSTLAALAFAPDVFAAGISMYGLSDLEAFQKRLHEAGAGEVWNRRVGDWNTTEGRALLRAHSPVHAADRIDKPLLITHGAKDTVAPREQSDVMVEALRSYDKPVTYLVYPDEPHDYRTADSWISFWAVAERFLHAHLGGRFEPYGDDVNRGVMTVVHGASFIDGLRDAIDAPDGTGVRSARAELARTSATRPQ